MKRRYINRKLAIVLLIGFAVLIVTAFTLRQWRRNRRANSGLALGISAYNEHKWEQAAKNLGRYLAVEPSDVSVLLKYADAQLNIRPLNRNNVQQAMMAYRTVLRIEKSNSKAANQLTGIYLTMGMPGEAELIANRALEANRSPKIRRMLAIAFANQRKFKEAASELRSIIEEHPDQILAYETLGRLIDQRPEDFPQVPQYWFDEAVKNNPSTAEAYIIRAAYHLRHNHRAEALADLAKAEQKDLSDTATRLRLAEQFINANELDKAQKHLDAIQLSEPANQTLWQTWAQLALKSNSKPIMLKVAETGLNKLASQPWDFMPTAAELYIKCDDLDHAGECISRLRQKDIAPATIAFLEGLLADRKGHGYEAVKHWRRAIQLGYNSPQIQLAMASVLYRLGDGQSALRQLENLVSERPDFFEGRLALARLLAKTGNWTETAEQARIAMQISPDSTEAALLHKQAQIQLLAEKQTDKDSPLWQNIEDHLTKMQNTTNAALGVKLLQFQLEIQRSNFVGAEALLTELKEAHPSQIKVAMAEIELLRATDKIDNVEMKLQDIIEKFPNFSEPVEYLAFLLDQQNKREKCEGIIKDALARIEQPLQLRKLSFLLADLYDRWGRRQEACELLTLLVEKLPNEVSIKRRLLKCEQVVKNPEKAQRLVNEIKFLEGEKGWQWRFEQAKIWLAEDDFESSYPQIVSILKENLLANPDDQTSRMLLAKTYEKAGQLQLAISTYDEALNRSQWDVRIVVPVLTALYRANEYDRADEVLHRLTDENLFHPDLEKLELKSHLRRGELNSAGDILEKLLVDDPNNTSMRLTLAMLRMRQNKFTEAERLLRELKIREPNSMPITIAQIQLSIHQNRPEEALILCNEIIDRLDNALAYIIRAKTFASLGQTDRAIEDFEHAVTIEPDNVEAWVACSNFYLSIGRKDNAVADIQQALSLAPDSLLTQKRAISLFLSSDNPHLVGQGRNILDEALKLNPEDIDLRLFRARSLLAEGTAPAIENAEQILQKITQEHPKTVEAWVLLGGISLSQGQLGKAIDIALRGLVQRRNHKSLLLLKARAEAARSPAVAIPTLKALWELDPNNADVAVLLAETYNKAGEPKKAVNLLKKQLLSCSGTLDERKVNIAIAVALSKNGDKREAQEAFDSLCSSVSDDPAPLLAQIELLKEDELWDQLRTKAVDWYQKHPEDIHTPNKIANDLATCQSVQAKKTAEGLLLKILDRNPDSLPAMNTLAVLLQTTGRSAESATLYRKILTLQPDNVIAINNLGWILCEEQGQYQQALQLVRQGLQKTPDYVDLIDTRGVIYYRLGEYDKAIRDFTQCLNLYPARAPSVVASYFHLGRALMSLGQKDEAIESLKKTLDLNNEIGNLSAEDFTEVQRLLEELSQGV